MAKERKRAELREALEQQMSQKKEREGQERAKSMREDEIMLRDINKFYFYGR